MFCFLLLLQWRYSPVLDVFSISPPGTSTRFGLLHPIGFSLSQDVQTGLGPNKPPIQCIPGFIPRGKAAGVWRWPLISIYGKTEWTYTSTLPTCLHGVDRKTLPLFTILAFALKVWIIIRKNKKSEHNPQSEGSKSVDRSIWLASHIISFLWK